LLFGPFERLFIKDRLNWQYRCQRCNKYLYSRHLQIKRDTCGKCERIIKSEIKYNHLLNKQFHTKVVKEKVYKNGVVKFLCQCCVCDGWSFETGARLTKNRNKRCKCSLQGGNQHGNWGGYGEIPAGYTKKVQLHAVEHGREYKLTLEFLWDLFLRQNRKCALSGVPIGFKTNKVKGNASLDRKDSGCGYLENNVQWLDAMTNWMKQDYSDDQFIQRCREVHYFNPVNEVCEYII
jgi:hypothetical protein